MADSRPEQKDPPRRDLKGFWLLPLLALGLGTLLVTRKPLPPEKPRFLSPQQMKTEAYRSAKDLVRDRVTESHFGSVSVIGFGPYQDNCVLPLEGNHFRCSGFLRARSRTGTVWREDWQCIVWFYQGDWLRGELQETQGSRPAGLIHPSPTSPKRRAPLGRDRRLRSGVPDTRGG